MKSLLQINLSCRSVARKVAYNHCTSSSETGLEPWSSGFGRRFLSWRSWVRISAPDGYIFTYICCKNCNVLIERVRGWPIFNKQFETGNNRRTHMAKNKGNVKHKQIIQARYIETKNARRVWFRISWETFSEQWVIRKSRDTSASCCCCYCNDQKRFNGIFKRLSRLYTPADNCPTDNFVI